jgi:hypothetical protein
MMIHRLSIRVEENRPPRLYIARHLVDVEHSEEGEFDISDVGSGIRVLCEGAGAEVVIPYEEIIKAVLEVV